MEVIKLVIQLRRFLSKMLPGFFLLIGKYERRGIN